MESTITAGKTVIPFLEVTSYVVLIPHFRIFNRISH